MTSSEDFLSEARRYLPDHLYEELERVVKAGQGRKPGDIVGSVPELEDRSLADYLADERKRRRSEFFDTPQTCGHNQAVTHARPGDWYHLDGTICDQPPTWEYKFE